MDIVVISVPAGFSSYARPNKEAIEVSGSATSYSPGLNKENAPVLTLLLILNGDRE